MPLEAMIKYDNKIPFKTLKGEIEKCVLHEQRKKKRLMVRPLL